jgi:transcriptional regulator with XRE-family HTH domain
LALIAKIWAVRLAKGFTQEAVAGALQKHQSHIAKLESGERLLDVREFALLCTLLDADPLPLLALLNRKKARTR